MGPGSPSSPVRSRPACPPDAVCVPGFLIALFCREGSCPTEVPVGRRRVAAGHMPSLPSSGRISGREGEKSAASHTRFGNCPEAPEPTDLCPGPAAPDRKGPGRDLRGPSALHSPHLASRRWATIYRSIQAHRPLLEVDASDSLPHNTRSHRLRAENASQSSFRTKQAPRSPRACRHSQACLLRAEHRQPIRTESSRGPRGTATGPQKGGTARLRPGCSQKGLGAARPHPCREPGRCKF